MSSTKNELKREAIKHIEDQSDLYYDVLSDMSADPSIYRTVIEEIMKRLVHMSNKYSHLEVE